MSTFGGGIAMNNGMHNMGNNGGIVLATMIVGYIGYIFGTLQRLIIHSLFLSPPLFGFIYPAYLIGHKLFGLPYVPWGFILYLCVMFVAGVTFVDVLTFFSISNRQGGLIPNGKDS